MVKENYICVCMGVSRNDIFRAIDQGAKDLDQLIEATGGSEGCGTCMNELYACFEQIQSKRLAREKELSQAQTLLPFTKK